MTARRRIAYFGSSTATDGGSELCLLRMAKYFSEKFEVTLFLPDEGPLYKTAKEKGIDAISLNFLRLRRYRGLEWLQWAKTMTRARNRLRQELQNRRIELVHFNDILDLPYASAPRRLGIPIVSHLRLILENPFAKAAYRIGVLRSRTEVVCVSKAVQENMIGDETRIASRVLYDPAPDPEMFFPCDEANVSNRKALRDKWGWPDNLFVVTMVSKLLPNKGHLNFLEVARRLEERTPGRYAFVLIAGSTPGRESFEREVSDAFDPLPADRKVWIRGLPNRELPQYLRACDLLLHLPDTPDSFPGVILEAMACGLPVVAHRVGGIPEQLCEGECGALISPGNWEEAIEEVERVASDARFRADIVRKAHLRLTDRFSPTDHFKSLEDLYEEVLD